MQVYTQTSIRCKSYLFSLQQLMYMYDPTGQSSAHFIGLEARYRIKNELEREGLKQALAMACQQNATLSQLGSMASHSRKIVLNTEGIYRMPEFHGS